MKIFSWTCLLFVICISSLVKCLWMSFTRFLIVCLLLFLEFFIYSRSNPLWDIYVLCLSQWSFFFLSQRPVHFEWNFIEGVKFKLRLILCVCVPMDIPIASASFVEKTILFPLNCFCTFVKIIWPYLYISISGLCSVPLTHVSISLPVLHYLDYCSYLINLNIG